MLFGMVHTNRPIPTRIQSIPITITSIINRSIIHINKPVFDFTYPIFIIYFGHPTPAINIDITNTISITINLTDFKSTVNRTIPNQPLQLSLVILYYSISLILVISSLQYLFLLLLDSLSSLLTLHVHTNYQLLQLFLPIYQIIMIVIVFLQILVVFLFQSLQSPQIRL